MHKSRFILQGIDSVIIIYKYNIIFHSYQQYVNSGCVFICYFALNENGSSHSNVEAEDKGLLPVSQAIIKLYAVFKLIKLNV